MRDLVIGDIHFGIKSNSIEWLEKQCKLINTQVTAIVKTKDIDRIVFLGDVFDDLVHCYLSLKSVFVTDVLLCLCKDVHTTDKRDSGPSAFCPVFLPIRISAQERAKPKVITRIKYVSRNIPPPCLAAR